MGALRRWLLLAALCGAVQRLRQAKHWRNELGGGGSALVGASVSRPHAGRMRAH